MNATADLPKLYVGSMNDGLFIIDKPPRPSHDDGPYNWPNGPNVIAKMTDNDKKASTLAKLFAQSPTLFGICKLYHDAFEIMNDAPDDSDKHMAQDKIAQAHRLCRDTLAEMERP